MTVRHDTRSTGSECQIRVTKDRSGRQSPSLGRLVLQLAGTIDVTRLILGSRNRKKLLELQDLLSDLPLEIVDLSAYPDAPDVEETGNSFAENAALKATTLAPRLGAWVLGEDSGLVVPALDGRPGIFSARFAGKHGDDAANNAKLLAELAGKPPEARQAYYVSSVVLADPTGTLRAQAEGRCRGVILTSPRGSGGFGYDPLFEIPEYHATFAELSLAVKQALSHRGRAIQRLRPKLRQFLQC